MSSILYTEALHPSYDLWNAWMVQQLNAHVCLLGFSVHQLWVPESPAVCQLSCKEVTIAYKMSTTLHQFQLHRN